MAGSRPCVKAVIDSLTVVSLIVPKLKSEGDNSRTTLYSQILYLIISHQKQYPSERQFI